MRKGRGNLFQSAVRLSRTEPAAAAAVAVGAAALGAMLRFLLLVSSLLLLQSGAFYMGETGANKPGMMSMGDKMLVPFIRCSLYLKK